MKGLFLYWSRANAQIVGNIDKNHSALVFQFLISISFTQTSKISIEESRNSFPMGLYTIYVEYLSLIFHKIAWLADPQH